MGVPKGGENLKDHQKIISALIIAGAIIIGSALIANAIGEAGTAIGGIGSQIASAIFNH